eukprot:11219365-Lingulodinium_polyedra.AAC.1
MTTTLRLARDVTRARACVKIQSINASDANVGLSNQRGAVNARMRTPLDTSAARAAICGGRTARIMVPTA